MTGSFGLLSVRQYDMIIGKGADTCHNELMKWLFFLPQLQGTFKKKLFFHRQPNGSGTMTKPTWMSPVKLSRVPREQVADTWFFFTLLLSNSE